ncbi:MAG TPA: hypothetical protein PLT62_06880, partial [Blautia wexlerae]|nr:hypothetical protein [Blautia wexlerae]
NLRLSEMLRGSFCVSFWGWRVWGRTGKYLFSDTAAEAGILSFRKFAKTMPEKFKLASLRQ